MASPREGATKKGKRVVVLGGGPIGVELACRAAADGWSVTLVEQDCPLAHVRAWGHVTLFSPWGTILASSHSPTPSPLGLDYERDAFQIIYTMSST